MTNITMEVFTDLLNEKNYWKNRCLLAEVYIKESPCDPDITTKQLDAYIEWNEAVKKINLTFDQTYKQNK